MLSSQRPWSLRACSQNRLTARGRRWQCTRGSRTLHGVDASHLPSGHWKRPSAQQIAHEPSATVPTQHGLRGDRFPDSRPKARLSLRRPSMLTRGNGPASLATPRGSQVRRAGHRLKRLRQPKQRRRRTRAKSSRTRRSHTRRALSQERLQRRSDRSSSAGSWQNLTPGPRISEMIAFTSRQATDRMIALATEESSARWLVTRALRDACGRPRAAGDIAGNYRSRTDRRGRSRPC